MQTESEVHAILADFITPETIERVWLGRPARGKLGLLNGDPGQGKSTLAAVSAACVTTGRALPGDKATMPAGVVFASLEHGTADTIVPRLRAAQADLRRVLVWESVLDDGGGRPPAIPDDLSYLEGVIERASAGLVVLDPLMALLGSAVNAHRDRDVRRALDPLARLAERTGAAVLVVRHLRKAAGVSALYRGGRSIGIVGAARTALLVARDPDDDQRRLLAPVKNNLSRSAPILAVRLATHIYPC